MSLQLVDILSSYGLTQHVDVPTHRSGHILDIIFSNICELPILSLDVDDSIREVNDLSFDHYPITFTVSYDTSTKNTEYVTKTIRNINAIDVDRFVHSCKDMFENDYPDFLTDNFCTCINNFNTCLKNNLNDFAPATVKTYLKNKKHLPLKWIDEEYRTARTEKRRLERFFKRNREAHVKARFFAQKSYCAKLAKHKMSLALSRTINNREKVICIKCSTKF